MLLRHSKVLQCGVLSTAVIGLLVALLSAAPPLAPGRASAQPTPRLFGATGANGVSAVLYTIDPNTGASTPIGPVTVKGIGVSITGLAFHPRNRLLFAVTGAHGSLPGHLLTIDPNTGAANDVGPLDIPTLNCGAPNAGIVGDITFSADGSLFGAGPCGRQSADVNLYTIGPGSSRASFVGAVAFENAPREDRQGFGLSFLPLTSTPQWLILFPLRTNQMYVINPPADPTTGKIPRTVVTLTGSNDQAIAALTADPSGTLLLGVASDGSNPSSARLIAIEPVTGEITIRGRLPDNMDALALRPPQAEVPPVAVPTLFEATRLLMAGVLVATGVWIMRRRRE